MSTLRIPFLRHDPSLRLPDHQPRGFSTSSRASMQWHPIRRREMLSRLCGEQNHRCCYCHAVMNGRAGDDHQATIEHIVSLSMGGADEWSNLAAACLKCNVERGRAASNYAPIRTTQPTGGIATLRDVMPERLRKAVGR